MSNGDEPLLQPGVHADQLSEPQPRYGLARCQVCPWSAQGDYASLAGAQHNQATKHSWTWYAGARDEETGVVTLALEASGPQPPRDRGALLDEALSVQGVTEVHPDLVDEDECSTDAPPHLCSVHCLPEAEIHVDPLLDDHAAQELITALAHTVDYVGNDVLPVKDGWSWFDALKKYAPEVARRYAERPVRTQVNREPQPSDGPDYPAEHQAWVERQEPQRDQFPSYMEYAEAHYHWREHLRGVGSESYRFDRSTGFALLLPTELLEEVRGLAVRVGLTTNDVLVQLVQEALIDRRLRAKFKPGGVVRDRR